MDEPRDEQLAHPALRDTPLARTIPTWTFALVVVRRGDAFLVARERKHGQRWYLPAGRVEPGESMADAARRETLEETGVEVELDGILRVEYTPMPDMTTRMRVVFLAHPVDGEATPRTEPNAHTLGARWVTLSELSELSLRGEEVRRIFAAVHAGWPAMPLSYWVREGDAWHAPRSG